MSLNSEFNESNEPVNPFALMTAPEVVFAALERSDRLARLKSTICRPLDKPRPEKPLVETKAFDEEIEAIEITDGDSEAANDDTLEPIPSLLG